MFKLSELRRFDLRSFQTVFGRGISLPTYGLEVTNVGTDRHQLSNIAEQARTEMGVETLDAVADRGYYSRRQRGALVKRSDSKPAAAVFEE
jgi:hypothetical protein